MYKKMTSRPVVTRKCSDSTTCPDNFKLIMFYETLYTRTGLPLQYFIIQNVSFWEMMMQFSWTLKLFSNFSQTILKKTMTTCEWKRKLEQFVGKPIDRNRPLSWWNMFIGLERLPQEFPGLFFKFSFLLLAVILTEIKETKICPSSM